MSLVVVEGLTAQRMLDIEAASVVDGNIVGNNLILTKHDGSTINAGSVRGPKGDTGDVGPSWAMTGMMVDWPVDTPPAGWLSCDGSSQLRSTYPNLFSLIGTQYGAPDGTHFYLPKSSGWRGTSSAVGNVPNATFMPIGSWVTDSGFTNAVGRYYSYSNPTFTFIAPGAYDLFAQVTLASFAAAARTILRFVINGSETVRVEVPKAAVTYPVTLNLRKTERLTAGDTLEVQIYQSSGGSVALGSPDHVFEMYPRDLGDIIKT